MSHLRAPATRADRREGGRHGRPVARPAPALPDPHIRPQLMRLAVLPPLAVALGASAAVLFSVRSAGTRTSPLLWAVIAGAVGVTVAGILIAAVAADRAARSVTDRVDALRRAAAQGEADLHALVDALRRGESPPRRSQRRRLPADADDFELLAADLTRAHDGAVTAVVRAAQLSSRTGSEQKLEVFVNLARRLQSLVHREILILDDLENEIEDPGLLKGLFHVDHLATRIRRHAENLAVLGGAVSRRQWSNPVSMTEVLRSAIAEVEQYPRVKLVPPVDGELRGHAVADVIHLLAELIENATVFSAPHTQVLLRASLVTSGLAVEVEDRGLGLPVAEQNRMNALLADPDQVNVASLLADGRIGLYVVSQLARRHGIHVRLQSNIYGGVQAVLVVPQAVLGRTRSAPEADTGASRQVPVPVPPPAREPAARPASGTVSGNATETVAGSTTEIEAGTDVGNGSAAGGGTGVWAGSAAGGGTGAWAGSAAGGGTGPVPATGRRLHAQRGSGRRDTESGTRGRHEGAPAPLPVRGARERRPAVADSVPGVSAEGRAVVEANAGVLPAPRVGTVGGTADKPLLPRRRAQEHIAPQLRGGPAPRQNTDRVAGHDPGLMAAFRRGIGLAEAQAQRNVESGYEEPRYGLEHGSVPAMDSGHMGSGHMGSGHSGHMGSDGTGSARTAVGHTESDHMGVHDMGSAPTASDHTTLDHRGSAHTASDHRGLDHTASGRTTSDHAAAAHMGAHDMGSPHTVPDPTAPEQTPAPAPIPQVHAHAHAPVHAPPPDGSRGAGRAGGSGGSGGSAPAG
ncbi:ATP-binding protein [Streptomyces sp. NRRL S-31]|uniref:sensor histidine kinase n=1 Tax=Streptomyces sp. NRRL S-31 TaxID=1463898 RepID=UPI000B14DA0F|nr:ATP-binding protein [Streptomyces sp. NRRL S-31]